MNLNNSTFAFVFGIIFLTLSICLACLRLRKLFSNPPMFNFLGRAPPPPDSAAVPVGSLDLTVGERGLDDSTLNSLPKMLYSEMKKSSYSNTDDPFNSSCSICLGDYKESDSLRLLPDCGHLYHLQCVDPWLKLHNTCPICRSSSSVKAHQSNSSVEGTWWSSA